MVALSLVAAACGASAKASTSAAAPRMSGFADTPHGLALAEVSGDGLHPPLQPTTFEKNLLAHPITYAVYQEALQAMASCVSHTLPGASVSFVANQMFPYLENAVLNVPPSGGTASLGGQAPTSLREATTVESRCEAEYSAQVEAAWTYQNRLSGSTLMAQRSAFLQCVASSGVSISASASLDQIHVLFMNPDWSRGLTASQNEAANKCLVTYATFLNSL